MSRDRRWIRPRTFEWPEGDVDLQMDSLDLCELTVDGSICEVSEAIGGRHTVRRVRFRSPEPCDCFAADYRAAREGEGFIAFPPARESGERPYRRGDVGAVVHSALWYFVTHLPADEATDLLRRAHQALLTGLRYCLTGAEWQGPWVRQLTLERTPLESGVFEGQALLRLPELQRLDTLGLTWTDEWPPLDVDRLTLTESSEHNLGQWYDEDLWRLIQGELARDGHSGLRGLWIRGPERYVPLAHILPGLPRLERLSLILSGSLADAFHPPALLDHPLRELELAHPGHRIEETIRTLAQALEGGWFPRLQRLMVRGLALGDALPRELEDVVASRGLRWAAPSDPPPGPGEARFRLPAPARPAPRPARRPQPMLTPLGALLAPYDVVKDEVALQAGAIDDRLQWPEVDRIDAVQERDEAIDPVEQLHETTGEEPYDHWVLLYEPVLGWEIAIDDARGGWSPDQVFGPSDDPPAE